MLPTVDRSDETEATPRSFEVIAAIAEREGVDPMELEPPEYEALYDVVNPGALDSLFAPRQDGTGRTISRVEFPFCGYDVTVTSDGEVILSERTPAEE